MIKHAVVFTKNKWKTRKVINRPDSINIEITSVCDSQCIHCPRSAMDRKMVPMPLDMFKEVLRQAAELKVPEVCLNGFGELMTITNLEEYFKTIRSFEGHRFFVVVNTNANLMMEDKQELLLKYDIDFLNICLDGATHETMSLIRKKLKPERIETNISNLITKRDSLRRRKPKIRLGFVLIDQNKHEANDFLEKWKNKAEMVGIDGYSNRGDSLDIEKIEGSTPKTTCVLPFNTMNIWSDGSCVLCCNDWNEESIVGSIHDRTLKEIWDGEILTNIRKHHYRKEGYLHDFCDKCNWWQYPGPGQKLFF